MSRIQSCLENLSGDAVMAAGKLAYYLFLLKLSSHQKKKKKPHRLTFVTEKKNQKERMCSKEI